MFCACKFGTGCHRHTVLNLLNQRELKGAKVYDEFPAGISSNNAYMELVQPNEILAVIVGSEPLTGPDLTKKVWGYIEKNGLQDKQDETLVNADAALQAVFGGKKQVSLDEMVDLICLNIQE